MKREVLVVAVASLMGLLLGPARADDPILLKFANPATPTDWVTTKGIDPWAKNIADKRYIISDVPTASLFTQLYFADPRTFGVQLKIKTDWSTLVK